MSDPIYTPSKTVVAVALELWGASGEAEAVAIIVDAIDENRITTTEGVRLVSAWASNDWGLVPDTRDSPEELKGR